MLEIKIDRIIAAEPLVKIDQRQSYLRAYPEIVRYFQGVEVFTRHEFIVGAHIVYGWMPTILEISRSEEAVDRAVGVLNRVRQGREAGVGDVEGLKAAINNSVVGASKMLHFLKPESYPIWDSVVYSYIHGKESQYQIGRAENYIDYVAACRRVTSDRRFVPVYESMKAKIGYEVSRIRVLELIMYVSESVRRQATKAASRSMR